jgi:serine/threonine protein kinase/Tfp pilus assembly protein PilF
MSLRPGTRFGPYEILTLLGMGGMGEVYQARDPRLNRVVALKFLPPDKGADPDRRRRFINEAQATSALNHPNIVTIHDISEADGTAFIVMEFVRGRTLDDLITGGALPLQEATRYATEMVDALTAAHAAGIIHRDLKPANIMITEEGRVKVLDFGLAKLAASSPMTGSEDNTATMHTAIGAIVGTAAYMSPEQAEGRQLDARSDVFSFGLVLYEMLSGRRAFDGESWVSVISAILRDEPKPLREVRAEIPAWLEQAVSRCLRKDPVERFQNMLDVKRTLAGPSSRSGVSTSVATAMQEEKPSIAVLSFANLSTDKENEYFGDGLAEEIINALTKIPELRVIARTSAFAFRGREHDVRAIGERLRVKTVLEGSVRRSGNRIRVGAQLIQVADESHLWSERYDREMTDIFAIQDEISQSIANALRVKLTVTSDRAENVEVYQLYLKGMFEYNHSRFSAGSMALAKGLFERAIALDPEYAPAYSGLAVVYCAMASLSLTLPTQVAQLAKSAAEKALSLDPEDSQAHNAGGQIAGVFDYNWPVAEKHFQCFMEQENQSALSRFAYALNFLLPQRRYKEAAEQYHRSLDTDPLSMNAHFGLAFSYYLGREYEKAIHYGKKALDIDANFWLLHLVVGVAQLRLGALEASIDSFRKSLAVAPFYSLALSLLAAAHVQAGQRDQAEQVIGRLREISNKAYVSKVSFAIYHAALGDAEEVFRCLNAAIDDREPFITRMIADEGFDRFRADPRFIVLLERMNLG